ncbi:hypothetical protein [Salipiger abyssi]|uniref:Uncharacterized protein n=1 Tax=Salipiger abyssi TaxID=1250539 RepID=A0A1P8UZW3_9RHOB|nr:hypothetical protein [Salipiger abyssi]APZ54933.1 hypothetical protein Ga0080574_TMP4599 [Salipiger abyssi]
MAIYRTFHKTARDFTMMKAALLVALLVLAQLLGSVRDAGGEIAQDAMTHPQVLRVLVERCGESQSAGPLI